MSEISYKNVEDQNGVFHFGTFIFGPIFLLFNGKIVEGLLWLFGLPILLGLLSFFYFSPGLNILIGLSFTLYYTSCGNEILWNHKKCNSLDEFNKVNKVWNYLSFVMVIFYILSLYSIMNH